MLMMLLLLVQGVNVAKSKSPIGTYEKPYPKGTYNKYIIAGDDKNPLNRKSAAVQKYLQVTEGSKEKEKLQKAEDDLTDLQVRLINREGYATKWYLDSTGNPTIGIGHAPNEEEWETQKNSFNIKQIPTIFNNHIEGQEKIVTNVYGDTLDKVYHYLNSEQKRKLKDSLMMVTFQLGSKAYNEDRDAFGNLTSKNFTNAHNAFIRGDVETAMANYRYSDPAAKNLENTPWFDQTPKRVEDLLSTLREVEETRINYYSQFPPTTTAQPQQINPNLPPLINTGLPDYKEPQLPSIIPYRNKADTEVKSFIGNQLTFLQTGKAVEEPVAEVTLPPVAVEQPITEDMGNNMLPQPPEPSFLEQVAENVSDFVSDIADRYGNIDLMSREPKPDYMIGNTK
jgi:GH24 family phage-related lysozyme (muramidase)